MNRIDHVLQVLQDFPSARNNNKELVVRVYQSYGAEYLTDILSKRLPSPDGILRDRRRARVLKLYPRAEDKYVKFQSYREEFSLRQPIVAQLFETDDRRVH